MRCSEAQEQLVAAHDGELGPSARVLLNEHLASCERCRNWDNRLRMLHLGGPLRIPPEVQRTLEARTDPRHLIPKSSAPRVRWARYVVAAAVLLGVVSAGVLRDTATEAPSVVHHPIPAAQFQPAAYQPDAIDVPPIDTNVLHLPVPKADEGPR
ncbi:MAG: zf-HC2 domain-containing protein [Myxococcota bacterium]